VFLRLFTAFKAKPPKKSIQKSIIFILNHKKAKATITVWVVAFFVSK